MSSKSVLAHQRAVQKRQLEAAQKQQLDKPPLPPIEEIATAIADLSKAMRKFNSSRLKRDAVVTLLAHQSKLPRKTIEIVLNNLQDMDRDYLKPLEPSK